MIVNFTVENFLSIHTPQTLTFEPTFDNFMTEEYCYKINEDVKLLKIGMIYGANASGKTNILSAINYFHDLMLRVPVDRNKSTGVIPFLLDDVSKNLPTKMIMQFYIGQIKYILAIEFTAQRILSETLVAYETNRPMKLYSRVYNAETDFSEIDFGSKLKLSKKDKAIISGNTLNNCSVLAAFSKSNVEKSKLNDVYQYFDDSFSQTLMPNMVLANFIKAELKQDKNGSLKNFALNLLKLSDFNIEDVALHEEEQIITPELEQLIKEAELPEDAKADMMKKGIIKNSELLFTHKAGEKVYDLSEDLESRGTMRFLGMAVILNDLLNKNQIMMIDEIETSIHYELLAYFIKLYLANSDCRSQLILTTHDINLLNEDFIRRDTIWFTEKDENGETNLLRLSDMGLNKNLSPYHAYKQGKLIQLPFLGSLYLPTKD